MVMKFYELDIKGKLMKQGILKPKSNDLDLRLWRNPCFKISKNSHPNLGETKNNSLSKMKLPIEI